MTVTFARMGDAYLTQHQQDMIRSITAEEPLR